MCSDAVRKNVNYGDFVKEDPLSETKRTTITSPEYAERFLRYFQDLPSNPGQAPLGIKPLPSDWEVLSHLAMSFCYLAPALDKPIGDHSRRRRTHASRLLSSLPRVIKDTDEFLREHIWLETRAEVCGITRDTSERRCSTLAKNIQEISQFLQMAERLESKVAVIRAKRKPGVDDSSNFNLFLMAAFLKHRGVRSETAIFQEIADYVNAHSDAGNRPTRLDQEDVRVRIRRFRVRNPELARKAEADVLGYIQRETRIVWITKNAET